MKKLLFSCLMLAIASCAMAQAPRLSPLLDTNSNTGSHTQYLTTPAFPDGASPLSLQYVGSKVSGTVTGVVKLQGSLDGTNYTYIGTDTLALANQATNTKCWDVPAASPRVKYRLEIVTSGTLSLQNKGYYFAP